MIHRSQALETTKRPSNPFSHPPIAGAGLARRTLTATARHALREEPAAKVELDALLSLHRDAKTADDSVDVAYAIAEVYAFRGENDRVFEWLARVEHDQTSKASTLHSIDDPWFGKLHTDPRWTAFLRRAGAAPEQLAKIDFKMSVPTAPQRRGG